MEKEDIKGHYSKGLEKDRLELELFKLEGMRSKEIISRFLTKENMNIADIGGGTGYYSFWLQSLGHHATLVDLTPENIEIANSYSRQSGIVLKQSLVAD